MKQKHNRERIQDHIRNAQVLQETVEVREKESKEQRQHGSNLDDPPGQVSVF